MAVRNGLLWWPDCGIDQQRIAVLETLSDLFSGPFRAKRLHWMRRHCALRARELLDAEHPNSIFGAKLCEEISSNLASFESIKARKDRKLLLAKHLRLINSIYSNKSLKFGIVTGRSDFSFRQKALGRTMWSILGTRSN